MPCFVAAALNLCWTFPSAVAGPIQKQMLLITLSQWLSLRSFVPDLQLELILN